MPRRAAPKGLGRRQDRRNSSFSDWAGRETPTDRRFRRLLRMEQPLSRRADRQPVKLLARFGRVIARLRETHAGALLVEQGQHDRHENLRELLHINNPTRIARRWLLCVGIAVMSCQVRAMNLGSAYQHRTNGN